MDEFETGMDPEVKRYFRKIINSFFMGLLWLMIIATSGLFFNLGVAADGLKWYNIIFYFFAFFTLVALVYYYYRVWSKK